MALPTQPVAVSLQTMIAFATCVSVPGAADVAAATVAPLQPGASDAASSTQVGLKGAVPTVLPLGPSPPQPKPVSPDLHSLHRDVVFEALPNAESPPNLIRKIRTVADAIHGKIEEHVWSDGGVERNVIVKKIHNDIIERMRTIERDDHTSDAGRMRLSERSRDTEDVLAELAIYCRIAGLSPGCRYLIQSHGVFKCQKFTYLVLEAADDDLFDVVVKAHGPGGSGMTEAKIMNLAWQLCLAVNFLHYVVKVCHNDISLENLLLKDGLLKLMDFGMATKLTALSTPRGKPYYMAPEMYSGNYQGDKCDYFACGMVILIIALGVAPWQSAQKTDKYWTSFLNEGCDIEALFKAHNKQPISRDGMDMLQLMLSPDPADRPTSSQCLENRWFAPLRRPVLAAPIAAASEVPHGAASTASLAGMSRSARRRKGRQMRKCLPELVN